MLESLRDIRLFVAVYEERSFTAAAQRENATQSGVSQHISKIEARFGVNLFSRGSGLVLPTPAADNYYRHCIEILRANEAATRALKKFNAGAEGDVTVGLMPTLTRCMMAPVLLRFMEANPKVTIQLTEAYSATLTQRVRAAELDFAIVPAFSDTSGLKVKLFTRTPEVLVSSVNSARHHLMPVKLSELSDLKLVMPHRPNTRRNTLETYISSNGISVERILELDAMMGTLDIVARSEWVTILPGIMMANEIQSPQFTINPLSSPSLVTDLVLIEPARRPLSNAAQIFLTMLEEEALRLSAIWDQK
jgi:LysR family nitrogen assimilation transcriptional regulator